MRHDRLIDKLGGESELARQLDVHKITVWRWRSTGIPARYWPRIEALAAEADIALGAEALKRGIPYPKGQQNKEFAPEQVS